jgi:hypothetical protein
MPSGFFYYLFSLCNIFVLEINDVRPQEVVQSIETTSNKTDVTSSNLLSPLTWTCQKKKKKKKKKINAVQQSV